MNVNASMIHELRMVIIHGMNLLKRTKGARRGGTTGTVLRCAPCLRERGNWAANAVTISRGNAVCLAHLS